MECGTDDFSVVGKCAENSTFTLDVFSRPAHMRNRCVGAKGGYPDLIAWEVVEELTQF